jgi:hypothetical protein
MSFFDNLSIIGFHLHYSFSNAADPAQENHERAVKNPERKRKAGKV